MKQMLVFAFAAWMAASLPAATVAFPDADGSHDIGSAAAWEGADPQSGDTVTFAGGVTYGLSADKSLPGSMMVTGAGKTCFDFSAGAKTLTVAGSLTDGAPDGRETVLKGGTWSMTGSFAWYLYGNGGSLLFDGVTMTATALPCFRSGSGTLANNSSCVLTNGTKVSLTETSYLFGASGTKWSTNNTLLVTGGSEVDVGAHALNIGGSYGDFSHDYTRDNRLIVRGAGSKFYTDGRGETGSSINIGYQCDGNTVIVEDGAWMRSYNFNLGQVNGDVPSSRNTLIIRTGGVWTNTQASAIGAGNGCHSNRVFVLSGGQLNVGKFETWAQLKLGTAKSSYNSLTLSNGTISARWVIVGENKNSHDNRLEILGTTSKIKHTDGDNWQYFGSGYNNEIVIDKQANFTFGTYSLATSTVTPGSNNTFAVRNGSVFNHSKGFTMGDGKADAANMKLEVSGGSQFLGKNGNSSRAMCSVGGEISVTEGSTFEWYNLTLGNKTRDFPGMHVRVAGEGGVAGGNGTVEIRSSDSEINIEDGAQMNMGNVYLLGNDSRLVISNATVMGAVSYAKIYMGVTNSNECAGGAIGTNTMMVFKGDHPLLTDSKGGRMQMFLGGRYSWDAKNTVPATLRYELPPNGYTESPVQNCLQVWAAKNLTIEIANLERCQRTITETKTFPLWEVTYAFQDNGFKDAVARLNKTLPRGCKAQIVSVSDESDVKARLTLTVVPKRGTALIVR